ncbi:hypothetical protein, partial [Acidovorax sp. MR-S7]|uniref:hypothetical protein n=1 Tax=Acidovorax sp. MR-S7 TaxID=1268622 RepID=UPI001F2BFE62
MDDALSFLQTGTHDPHHSDASSDCIRNPWVGLVKKRKPQKRRLCHKSVLMTGTPMASSKSWRGFA